MHTITEHFSVANSSMQTCQCATSLRRDICHRGVLSTSPKRGSALNSRINTWFIKPIKTFLTSIFLNWCNFQRSFFVVVRCGSVIVDLALRFSQIVSESDVISVLKTAAQEDKFGSFIVDPESIKQTSPSSTATPAPTTTGGTQGIVTC